MEEGKPENLEKNPRSIENKQQMGSMGGVVARCSPLTTVISGSIPGLAVMCELSLLLILSLTSRVFLLVLQFSSLISKFQFNHGRGQQVYQLIQLSRATLVKQSRLFIILFRLNSNLGIHPYAILKCFQYKS
jgi:hypothetical protein